MVSLGALAIACRASQRPVAGYDQFGMHRESVEPAGTSFGDRVPDRACLRFGHAVRHRHLKMGKRHRASAGAHGPPPRNSFNTTMIALPGPLPCPALPLRLHSRLLECHDSGSSPPDGVALRTSHPLARSYRCAVIGLRNSVPFCHVSSGSRYPPLPSAWRRLLAGHSRALAEARGVHRILATAHCGRRGNVDYVKSAGQPVDEHPCWSRHSWLPTWAHQCP